MNTKFDASLKTLLAELNRIRDRVIDEMRAKFDVIEKSLTTVKEEFGKVVFVVSSLSARLKALEARMDEIEESAKTASHGQG